MHKDLHHITRGGICTLYRALAAELAHRGHHVTVVIQASSHPVIERPRTPAGGSMHVVTLPCTGDNPEDLAVHERRVAAALDDIRPDVAECSTWEHELLHYLARDHDRVPGWCAAI